MNQKHAMIRYAPWNAPAAAIVEHDDGVGSLPAWTPIQLLAVIESPEGLPPVDSPPNWSQHYRWAADTLNAFVRSKYLATRSAAGPRARDWPEWPTVLVYITWSAPSHV